MVLVKLSKADKQLLRLLIDSEGRIQSGELSQRLGIPFSTVQRRRKKLEETYLMKTYALDPLKFGLRRIDLLIYTEGGATMEVGKMLLKRKEVTFAVRTIGEPTIDLRVEVLVKDNRVLLNLLEEVKAMKGVRDVVWTEVVETVGEKSQPDVVFSLLASER
ncbi:MAG: Lrp/AsnC family transcriptional regulator [Nitrososphaerales archaeon]